MFHILPMRMLYRRSVNCGMTLITWWRQPTNQRHSALFILQITSAFRNSALYQHPHVTHRRTDRRMDGQTDNEDHYYRWLPHCGRPAKNNEFTVRYNWRREILYACINGMETSTRGDTKLQIAVTATGEMLKRCLCRCVPSLAPLNLQTVTAISRSLTLTYVVELQPSRAAVHASAQLRADTWGVETDTRRQSNMS